MKATRVVRRDSVILQKIKQMPQAAGNVSKEKLLAFAQPIMDDIVQSAHVIASIKLRGIIPPSAAAAMIFLSKRKPEAAQFVKDIVTGAGLARGDPAYTLREHLLNRQRMGGKLHKSYVFGMMIKMFNKRMENEKVGAIRLSEGEKFPKLAA
jgi:hypothetical protein